MLQLVSRRQQDPVIGVDQHSAERRAQIEAWQREPTFDSRGFLIAFALCALFWLAVGRALWWWLA